MSRVDRQRREVERGRTWGTGGVVEREKREVDRGSGGRGDRGSSIKGCWMWTGTWQAVGWNSLKEGKKGRQGQCRTHVGYWEVRANEEEKYRCESDSERWGQRAVNEWTSEQKTEGRHNRQKQSSSQETLGEGAARHFSIDAKRLRYK